MVAWAEHEKILEMKSLQDFFRLQWQARLNPAGRP